LTLMFLVHLFSFQRSVCAYIHSICYRPRGTCAFISYYYEIMVSTTF